MRNERMVGAEMTDIAILTGQQMAVILDVPVTKTLRSNLIKIVTEFSLFFFFLNNNALHVWQ